jgi:hypothetical protein
LEEALAFAKNVSTIKYTNKGNAAENKLFGRAFSEAIDVFIHFKKPLLVLRLLNKLKRTQFCPFSLHFAAIKAVLYCKSPIIQWSSALRTPRPTTSPENSSLNSWRVPSRASPSVNTTSSKWPPGRARWTRARNTSSTSRVLPFSYRKVGQSHLEKRRTG